MTKRRILNKILECGVREERNAEDDHIAYQYRFYRNLLVETLCFEGKIVMINTLASMLYDAKYRYYITYLPSRKCFESCYQLIVGKLK